MADENNKEKQVTDSKGDDSKQQGSDDKTTTNSFLKWIIMAVVVVFCAGAGFKLGRLFGRSGASETDVSAQQTEPIQMQDASQIDSKDTWYYDFEPVVANLNDPGVTRYIRVALTLQISNALDSQKGISLLEKENPLLRSWLTIYLTSQTIEDIRGNRNLRRIQSEILDAFNEKLFPDAKPQIKSVLFKEFAIQ